MLLSLRNTNNLKCVKGNLWECRLDKQTFNSGEVPWDHIFVVVVDISAFVCVCVSPMLHAI